MRVRRLDLRVDPGVDEDWPRVTVLATHAGGLAERGYRLGWVAPERDDPGGLLVGLRIETDVGPDGHVRQLVVRLRRDPDLDDATAAELADALLRQPTEQWEVAFGRR